MTSGSPAVFGQSVPPDAAEPDAIDTRFGRITLARHQLLTFPGGLLGMPETVHFGLTTFPSAKMARFTLLQSLDNLSLSFITLPLPLENPIISADDLTHAASDLHIPLEHFATLLIVNVSRDNGGLQLWVNARAPIFLDAAKRLGGQHVFSHNKYEIRQPLTF